MTPFPSYWWFSKEMGAVALSKSLAWASQRIAAVILFCAENALGSYYQDFSGGWSETMGKTEDLFGGILIISPVMSGFPISAAQGSISFNLQSSMG